MSKRLLVVDDEPNLLRAVSMLLRVEGYEVVTAQSGKAALVRVAESLPDLIVSDVRMPGMDGYQLLHALRSSPRTSLVPVVFLTAKGETEDRIEGFRAGVDTYVIKPFEPDELVAIIGNILNRVERTHAQIAHLVSTPETHAAATTAPPPASAPSEDLTDAEWRVAEAVAHGLSNKEIASQLRISVRTVENHISHILAKKNYSNRVEIARHVFERSSSE